MGSSSQHYRDTAPSLTEEWDNVTVTVTEGYWLREAAHRPDWDRAVRELRWTWDLHVYGMASLFSMLCVYCLLAALRLHSQLSERPHLSSLNVFLGILAASRLVVLFADPYGSRRALPVVLLQVLWDLGYPCLVSAFALLQLSFVRMTQMKTSRLTEESAITIAITFHFCLIITSGVLGALQQSLRILWLLTQVAFILWGGFLCISSFLGCLRLLRSIVQVPKHIPRQVDPAHEIPSISPGALFCEPHPPAPLHPRIRITDVNEQTYSYASDVSLSTAGRERGGVLISPQSVESPHPLSTLRSSSPTHWRTSESRSHPISPNEDPALVRPLIAVPGFQEESKDKKVPGIGSLAQTPTSPPVLLHSSGLAQIRVEDIQADARKLKRQCRGRVERQLRRLALTSGLGVALCLLKTYDVFGQHGILAARGGPVAVIPWFCFQTGSRIVEFVMAYTMAVTSQQSMLNNHYYYNYN